MNDTEPVVMTLPSAPVLELETAPLWRRLLAGLLDAIPVAATAAIAALVAILTDPEPLRIPPWNWFDQVVDYLHDRPLCSLLIALSGTLAFVLWPVFFVGDTPGRRLLSLRMVAPDGGRPRRLAVLGWSLLRLVGLIPGAAGFNFAFIDRERRTLYDRIARLWLIAIPRAPRPRGKSPNRRLPVR
jgi:uncharacterized RDD family membrane protein YckC